MTHSSTATIGFTVFVVAALGWRAWETFRKQGAARGSTSMMWSFYALVGLTTVIFVGTMLEFFLVSRPFRPAIAVAGVALFGLANWLRIVAIRALDRYWSLHIEIREQQPLIQQGPYGWVRHPAYSAFVIEHVAVPLVGNAWWSLGLTLLLYVPMILWRIHKEEAALVAKFGERYRDYQRRVGRLVPRLSTLLRSGAVQPDGS